MSGGVRRQVGGVGVRRSTAASLEEDRDEALDVSSSEDVCPFSWAKRWRRVRIKALGSPVCMHQ